MRAAPAATAIATWQDLTSITPNTPGYSSFGYCDGQCSYDNYVYVPKGADPDTVYLSGDNEYNENNYVTGRSNGRARAALHQRGRALHGHDRRRPRRRVSGAALHPDHHALVTNPNNWQQFFDLGDGGVARSNGVFVDDSGDCAGPKLIVDPARLAFCQLLLSRVPERLDAINKGLRTLHFYQIEYSKHDPDRIAGGTQDNGSWETLGDPTPGSIPTSPTAATTPSTRSGGDPNFRLTALAAGPARSQLHAAGPGGRHSGSRTRCSSSTATRRVPFIGNAITDPVTPAGCGRAASTCSARPTTAATTRSTAPSSASALQRLDG